MNVRGVRINLTVDTTAMQEALQKAAAALRDFEKTIEAVREAQVEIVESAAVEVESNQ